MTALEFDLLDELYFVISFNALQKELDWEEAILKTDAVKQSQSAYGTNNTVDFEFTFNNKTAIIITGWIVENNDSIAKLITCFI